MKKMEPRRGKGMKKNKKDILYSVGAVAPKELSFPRDVKALLQRGGVVRRKFSPVWIVTIACTQQCRPRNNSAPSIQTNLFRKKKTKRITKELTQSKERDG